MNIWSSPNFYSEWTKNNFHFAFQFTFSLHLSPRPSRFSSFTAINPFDAAQDFPQPRKPRRRRKQPEIIWDEDGGMGCRSRVAMKGSAYSEFDMDFFLQFLSNQIPQKVYVIWNQLEALLIGWERNLKEEKRDVTKERGKGTRREKKTHSDEKMSHKWTKTLNRKNDIKKFQNA